ncbi:exopolyphosphatase [Nematocida sp. AWRm77]|nr:exopolyphosphatase [Nematocida sp. AWRm77]
MLDHYKQILQSCGFKEKLKEVYQSGLGKTPLKITMGNASCDQDSFLGSHVLGIVEGRVPVVNLEKDTFRWKKDLMEIVEMVGLGIDDLVFLEKRGGEVCLVQGSTVIKVKEREVQAFIVDYNLPSKDLLECSTFSVDQVIDHHPIQDANAMYCQVHGMCINLNAGSCCSLIYKDIKERHGEKISQSPKEYMFLVLLSIPILTDTSCFSKRTHDVDRNGVKDLLSMAGLTMDEATEMKKHLKHRMKDVTDTPGEYILLMDYKTYDYPANIPGKSYGISSVRYPYDEWVKRDGMDTVLTTIAEFMKKQNNSFFIINGKSGEAREMYVNSAPGADFIQKVFYGGKPGKSRKVDNNPLFEVHEVDPLLSRKILAPKVQEYLESMK